MKVKLLCWMWSVFVCSWFFVATSGAQAKTEPTPKALSTSWLALIDAGKYSEAWKAAAPVLQQKISEQDWQKLLQGIPEKFGKVQKRKLIETISLNEMPDNGPGEYLVILYRTACQKVPKGLYEKLTLMKVDGAWKVAGYYIQ